MKDRIESATPYKVVIEDNGRWVKEVSVWDGDIRKSPTFSISHRDLLQIVMRPLEERPPTMKELANQLVECVEGEIIEHYKKGSE